MRDIVYVWPTIVSEYKREIDSQFGKCNLFQKVKSTMC